MPLVMVKPSASSKASSARSVLGRGRGGAGAGASPVLGAVAALAADRAWLNLPSLVFGNHFVYDAEIS